MRSGLILFFLLALLACPGAFAQADNPYTWLRVLNVPIYEGPVESVTIVSRKLDANGNPGRLRQQDTWQFAPGNLPTHHLTIAQSRDETIRRTADWTFDSKNFPFESHATMIVNAGTPLHMRTRYHLEGNTMIGIMTSPDYEAETRWVVNPEARRITGHGTLESVRLRSTQTFDAQWSARTFHAEVFVEGRWEHTNTIEYGPRGLRLSGSGIWSTEQLVVSDYDTYGNPVQGIRDETIRGNPSRSIVTWDYTYRDATPTPQAASNAVPAEGVAQNAAPDQCNFAGRTGSFHGIGDWLDPAPFVLRLDGHTLPACEALLFNTGQAITHAVGHARAEEAAAAEVGFTIRDVYIAPHEVERVVPWSLGEPLTTTVHGRLYGRLVYVYAPYRDRVTGDVGILVTVHPY